MIRRIVSIEELNANEKLQMFILMKTYYDNVIEKAFFSDLMEKDLCILLLNKAGDIMGFSTQKIIALNMGGKAVHGIFSGDTIIHKDYWGSFELFKGFCEIFIEYGKPFDEYFWFLISKGYKTYKMLPLFFKEFYPSYKKPTPIYEKSIIDAFGKERYPDEYNEKSGNVEYNKTKDRLKKGVANIDEKHSKDKHIEFFANKNPGHIDGNDIVCLTSLKEDNIRKTAYRLFIEGE